MATGQSSPRWVWWLSIPAVVVVVTVGVWITGGVVTNDETVAKTLTGVWFAVAGVVAIALAWRYRWLAWPILGSYVITAGVVGGFLLYTSSVDQVVDEDVVTVAPEPAKTQGSAEPSPANIEVGRGDFVDGAHPTSGVASLIDTDDGSRVLTLTNFETDPGPDLRVYLVSANGNGVSGGIDLGALKGNKGDQQYEVPQDAPSGQVVIWCRAFSVAFGSAQLA